MSKPANYYVIVKRDFTRTKTACAVQPAFTDKRNALEAMEDYTFGCVAEADGLEYAKRCLIDESMHMKFTEQQFKKRDPSCLEHTLRFLETSKKERDTELKEQGFARLDNGKFNPKEGYVLSEDRFLRKSTTFPKKHFITRDVESSTDRLTIWRKYDVEKTVAGTVWGTKKVTETLIEKQFSVEVITIPSNVLHMTHNTPSVDYRPRWYQTTHLPKDMTEDQYIEKERKGLAKDFSACLNELESFKTLAHRFKDEEEVSVYEEAETLELPRLRYEFAEEFSNLPHAQRYVSPAEEKEEEEEPELESIPTEEDEDKDNIPEES